MKQIIDKKVYNGDYFHPLTRIHSNSLVHGPSHIKFFFNIMRAKLEDEYNIQVIVNLFIEKLWLTNLNSLIDCEGKRWDALECRLTCFSSLSIVIDLRCDQPTRALDLDLRLWTDWSDQVVVNGVAAQSNNGMTTHGAVA